MTTDSPYLEIAAYIRQARLARRISARELADAVHIRERYILALEAGQIEMLPGEVYARGYIQRILEFLEIDAAGVLAEFDAVTDEPSRKLFLLNMRWGDSPHPTPQFAFACAGAAILLLFAVQSFRHTAPAPLIDSYTVQEVSNNATPVRCTRESTWPCFWENVEMWYTTRVQKNIRP